MRNENARMKVFLKRRLRRMSFEYPRKKQLSNGILEILSQVCLLSFFLSGVSLLVVLFVTLLMCSCCIVLVLVLVLLYSVGVGVDEEMSCKIKKKKKIEVWQEKTDRRKKKKERAEKERGGEMH